ncbi:MAG TPA: TIM barrel protein [Candidatus Hydrogenedentes bacterium]|nr:TIM barrel protein [Candidatus Hydrogenedentota bacterium]HOV76014.1 TIM barrel protein [Candidatus Hydrogenedentota bacterium]HPC15882.1 TIM barrel protein [Candidatus Hydrogenedentota bacterium]HRT19836.1 TIM barrel protein [Candidatus Hydrogenedentota bacterium]HRT65416.1 TIM barrel protein [Candidatus Hydrogenedentota bacterium]
MPAIRVGNAPCSWGALEFESLEGESAGFRRVLDEMAATGYAGTELGDWGFMPTEPDRLRAELESRGMTLIGAFVPVALKEPALHAEGEAAALRVARLLAAASPGNRPFLVLADDNGTDPVRTKNAGRIAPDMGLSDAEWEAFAEGTNRIARAVKAACGLRTVFHHHCGGYIETPDEVARLMAMTDPGVVGLVLDTGHYAYGAGNSDAVIEALDRFADRIWHMHFKDCDPGVAARARAEKHDYFEAVGHGVFCELGRGCVDFGAVMERLNARAYAGWVVVEQDVLPGMGTPMESARRNRAFLATLGL